MRTLAAALCLLSQSLWAQVKTDLAPVGPERPGTALAVGGGAPSVRLGAKLSAPTLVSPVSFPLNAAVKVHVQARAETAPALPPSALAAPSAPESGEKKDKPSALDQLKLAAAGTGGSFRDQTFEIIQGLKGAQSSFGDNVVEIAAAQQSYKRSLLEASAAVLKKEDLSPSQVASHGTTLRGLWGMLVSGGIEATSSYHGFSGESAEVWAGAGIEGGASYGAKRGVAKGLPGVSIILYNRSRPLKIVGGETLDRRPTPKDDFLAAVVTDGENTLVLDRAALAALAHKAEAWKADAVEKAKSGKMGAFGEWERVRDFFDPTQRSR